MLPVTSTICAIALLVGKTWSVPTRQTAGLDVQGGACAKIVNKPFGKVVLVGLQPGKCVLQVTWTNRPKPTSYEICVSTKQHLAKKRITKQHRRIDDKPRLEIPGWSDRF